MGIKKWKRRARGKGESKPVVVVAKRKAEMLEETMQKERSQAGVSKKGRHEQLNDVINNDIEALAGSQPRPVL
ncbi:hypothetical protein HS088_TW01G00467 [Tripterygium wilfordii]|uniref:Uncharacterized protein n=1 Tax=Tripterygium wilfordii TaxID=458696 RepID=A0A7J7E1K5_TRIWF|nr:hypothetical protein HS088_TW01G00467 [Tripterygium wilfordii]